MSYTYAPNGLDVTQVQTALGSVLLGYDAQRRPSSYQYFEQAAEQTIYDTLGRKVSWTASNGEARTYSYGADMRLQEVDGAGQVLGKWQYDAKGLVQTYTDGAGMVLQYVYDNLDRPTSVNYPDSGSRQVTYGGCPAVVLSETSRGGAQTLYEYDPARQLVAVTNSARERTQYEHDADGNVTRVVNAAGKTAVRTEYDVMDRRVAEYDGLNQKTSYQYGGFGERAAVASPTGTSIKYGYNSTLDLTSLTPTDGKTAAIGLTYDAYGRPQTMTDAVGTTQYAYNADSTLKTLDGPFVNDTLTYGYDPRGRLQSIQTQGGWLVTYTYDGLGRLASVSAGGEVFQYAYVGASQLVSTLTYPIGVVTTNTYDNVERLTKTVTVRTEDSVVLAQHDYAYDARDQATTITRTNVLEVAVPEAGKSTAKFDDANQLVEKDGAAYSYDAAGNLIHGPGWDYRYDAFNRLVQAKGKVQVDYAYDGNSMLRQIEEDADRETRAASGTREVRDGVAARLGLGAESWGRYRWTADGASWDDADILCL